jgi:uncharacterized SAM-binding protein YcdF (DUF218 family)
MVAQPAHLLPLLLMLAATLSLTGPRHLGLGLSALVALLILTIAVLPVGTWLLSPLEKRFSTPRQMPTHVDGVIMLGGTESIAFADMAKCYPEAKLVYAGGGPTDPAGLIQEATAAGRTPRWLGVDISRITFARESRNTFEDVVVAKAAVHPGPGETWILITGAFHMPRSVGLFRGQGWQVVPYPVDYGTGAGSGHFPFSFNFSQNFDQLSVALKEWIGMFANRLLGHSEDYFPAPLLRSHLTPRRSFAADA